MNLQLENGEEGKPDYIGRIMEFFKATNNKSYFTTQWFFKAEDIVIKDQSNLHDTRRVFLSNLKDVNLIVSSLRLVLYEFFQMYVRHNSFSKQKILLSKINLICMIQDVFSYQISRMSTYSTVSFLRLVLYEFLQIEYKGQY